MMPQRNTEAGLEGRIQAIPNYGIDGPGFMWGFLGGSLFLAGAGLAVFGLDWAWAGFIAAGLWLFAATILALGLSMLSYSFLGKQRLRDHLLRQYRWRGNETVLDIGTGRGLMAVGAAKRVPFGRVLALDIWAEKDLSGNSPAALLRNAEIENVGNITVITGDARRIELDDGTIDVVTSVFCLHNIEPEEDRDRACAEIVRLLKPGGMAMIADFPGTAGYVRKLASLGLAVRGPYRSERIGLGISGYLIAEKIA